VTRPHRRATRRPRKESRSCWLAWPAKVGPLLAAQLEVDAGTLTVALEGYVRDQLAELASERCEF